VNDNEAKVRRAIALNHNLDPRYYEKLVNDNDPYVRQNLEKNPSYKKYKKVQLKEEK
jgi:hypothetical protein